MLNHPTEFPIRDHWRKFAVPFPEPRTAEVLTAEAAKSAEEVRAKGTGDQGCYGHEWSATHSCYDSRLAPGGVCLIADRCNDSAAHRSYGLPAQTHPEFLSNGLRRHRLSDL